MLSYSADHFIIYVFILYQIKGWETMDLSSPYNIQYFNSDIIRTFYLPLKNF